MGNNSFFLFFFFECIVIDKTWRDSASLFFDLRPRMSLYCTVC